LAPFIENGKTFSHPLPYLALREEPEQETRKYRENCVLESNRRVDNEKRVEKHKYSANEDDEK
jgi:hypothetical protein